MKRNLIFNLFLFTAFVTQGYAETLLEVIKNHGVNFSAANDWQITKSQNLKGEKRNQRVLEANGPAGAFFQLKIIEPLSAKEAQQLEVLERGTVEKLYAAQGTPYMGDIASVIGGCPARFGPFKTAVTFLGQKTEALLAAAKADHAFGACSDEEAKLKGALVFYYQADRKAVWIWRFFVPWDDRKSSLRSNWLKPILDDFSR